MLPTELRELLDQIDACEKEAVSLVADLDEESVNRRPPPGTAWSVAQCLDHLTVMNGFYLRDVKAHVDRARAAGIAPFAGLGPTPPGRWFVASMEPPPRFKMKARRQVMPHARFALADVLPSYIASLATYRELVHACAAVDVNRVVLPNPFFKQIRMRVSTMLLIIPAHDRRHVWQAGVVKGELRL